MRYLLKEDDARLKELSLYIEENVLTKKPNKKKERIFRGRFSRPAIEQNLIIEEMMGNKISIQELFLHHLNTNKDFVCFDLNIEIGDDFIDVGSKGFEPTAKWNRLLKEKEDLLILENKGFEYVISLNQGDTRNFFELNDEIRFGIRSKNLEEPRLLGEITDSLFIMSSEDYDSKLKSLKI